MIQRRLASAVHLDVLEHHDVLLGKQLARLPFRAVHVIIHLQLTQKVREDFRQILELVEAGLSQEDGEERVLVRNRLPTWRVGLVQ